MIIDLTKRLVDTRITRVVIGRSFCMDISEIFEVETRDMFTGELITHGNFDDDDVYYFQHCGYTLRSSLVELGFTELEVTALSEPICLSALLEG